MDLQRIKADEPADLIVDALGEQGAVIVEGLLSDDVLSRFNAELDPLLDAAAWGDGRRFINHVIGWFFGAQTRHVTGIAGGPGSSPPRSFLTPYIARWATRSCCRAVRGTNSTLRTCSTGGLDPISS